MLPFDDYQQDVSHLGNSLDLDTALGLPYPSPSLAPGRWLDPPRRPLVGTYGQNRPPLGRYFNLHSAIQNARQHVGVLEMVAHMQRHQFGRIIVNSSPRPWTSFRLGDVHLQHRVEVPPFLHSHYRITPSLELTKDTQQLFLPNW